MNDETGRVACRQLTLFAPSAEAVSPAPATVDAPERSPVAPPDPTHTLGPPDDPVDSLRRALDARVTPTITSVVLTRNRSRIVSAKRLGDGLEVRIHCCFADADDTVLDAVARLLAPGRARGDAARRRALAIVREHFRRHGQADAEVATRARRRLRPVGTHHNLLALRDRVNREYFDDAVAVDITWGRDAPRRRRRGRAISLRLGSFAELERLVRVHPVLDRADVPEYVVESVVHHEMLHAVVPIPPGRGRRRVHTAEFRRREREHRHFERAERWIADNLERLARLR
ncbi:MAG: hypothetical protein AAGC60_08545 [Acidobacteriota bacterium]